MRRFRSVIYELSYKILFGVFLILTVFFMAFGIFMGVYMHRLYVVVMFLVFPLLFLFLFFIIGYYLIKPKKLFVTYENTIELVKLGKKLFTYNLSDFNGVETIKLTIARGYMDLHIYKFERDDAIFFYTFVPYFLKRKKDAEEYILTKEDAVRRLAPYANTISQDKWFYISKRDLAKMDSILLRDHNQ